MLQVKIDTRLKVNENGIESTFRIKNEQVVQSITRTAISTVKNEAPVASGVFRDSIRRLDSKGAISLDGTTERFIRIGSNIYYKKYVIYATKPSAGRYVPSLDIRIRSGQHPGTKANPMMIIARRKLQPKIQAILSAQYSNGDFKLGRFING